MSSNGGAIKAVIYDCDGVMFDSFEANLAFYQRIMEMMGRPPLSRDNGEQMRILHTYANREVLSIFSRHPATGRKRSGVPAPSTTGNWSRS